MPAVARGGKRQNVRGETGAKGKAPPPRRAVAARPTAVKLHAARAFGVPAGAVSVLFVGALVVGVAAVLFTGGRAEALGAAVGQAVDGRLAALGVKLRAVHVRGASAEALPYVTAALGLELDQPLAGLDLNEVRARVERVGWVKEAKVVRLLPDTLVVEIVERDRLAVWQHRGETFVVDALGAPIPEADPGRFPELPLVVGAGAAETAAEVLPLVAARPRLAGRLDALVRVDERRWDLRLKDGSLIQLPALNEDAALIQLDQLDQKARVLELGFARIDLRDPEMIVVRPRDARTGAAIATGV